MTKKVLFQQPTPGHEPTKSTFTLNGVFRISGFGKVDPNKPHYIGWDPSINDKCNIE